MDDEEFYIDFMFKGRNYTGLVAINQRSSISTFIIRYSMEPARLFENSIELCAVVGEETEPLEWLEINEETENNRLTELSLVKVIGEALEGREI
jgi:hypothetical protein